MKRHTHHIFCDDWLLIYRTTTVKLPLLQGNSSVWGIRKQWIHVGCVFFDVVWHFAESCLRWSPLKKPICPPAFVSPFWAGTFTKHPVKNKELNFLKVKMKWETYKSAIVVSSSSLATLRASALWRSSSIWKIFLRSAKILVFKSSRPPWARKAVITLE